MSVSTGRFISESIVTLSCTVTLPSTVNSGETVVTTWFGPSGEQLRNSSTVTVSNAVVISNGVFQSSTMIAGFVPASNNGDYSCNATVMPPSTYVIGNSAATRRTVMISGWYQPMLLVDL